MKQGSKEWLEMRRGKIGASDAPIIRGISPWCTPLKLWRQKVGLEPEVAMTPAMERGHKLEPKARKVFEKKMKKKFPAAVIFSDQFDWQMASLDGLSKDGLIAEFKAPNLETRIMASKGKLPDYYMDQVQHQIFVKGAEMAFYFAYDEGSDDGHIVEVPRNDVLIAQILEAEKDFWRRIQEYDPPEGQSVQSCLVSIEKQYILAKKKEQEAKEEMNQALELLKQGANGQPFNGVYLKLTPYLIEGRVRYQDIPELQGVDLDQYRGIPSEGWRVTMKKSA